MAPKLPTLIFVPGAWHKPTCYSKVMNSLKDDHGIKCVSITLPSTTDNPNATLEDDIDTARNAMLAETTQARDVIVIAHSYGGLVGNNAIKGLTPSKANTSTTATGSPSQSDQAAPSEPASQTEPSRPQPDQGYVKALILIASGFTFTGLSFMDPFFGIPPPSWRIDKPTGYATLVADPRSFFYHGLPSEEAAYWVSQLTTQNLKSLFEGGEHAYAGWQDVPNWYIGTVEDKGLPVVVQRINVGFARAQGAVVHHVELMSSHSPFLSRPGEVVDVMMEAVRAVSGMKEVTLGHEGKDKVIGVKSSQVVPMFRLMAPRTWFKYGMPLLLGRALGVGFSGFMCIRKLWSAK